MNKWGGTFQELKEIMSELGIQGDWSETERDKTFRASTGAILKWYPSTGTLQYQGKKIPKEQLQAQLAAVKGAVYPEGKRGPLAVRERAPESMRIFVVHGHDEQAREQLELVLHRLSLEPFVLANTGGGGLTIIEALEREMGPGPDRSRFGIVLMTPDDFGYSKLDGADSAQPRARQNVILEMGMLIAKLGRPKVVILKRGHVEVPSDAAGIIYLGFNDHVREVVPRLCDRLRDAGFDLPPEAITRASS
jgi:predicted nucleotide-binding protein